LDAPLAEALWNGILFSSTPPRPSALFALVKSPFLELFDEHIAWLGEAGIESHAAELLGIATLWGRDGRSYVSGSECRAILRKVSDEDRVSVLGVIRDAVSQDGGWQRFGQDFLDRAWPQEAKFQTAGTSEALVRIAEADHDNFPAIVEAVFPFLRAVDYPDLFIFRERRDQNASGLALARRWPAASLRIAGRIIGDSPAQLPYEIAEFLSDIVSSDPSLRDDPTYRRLRSLLDR
jgi:hypothetical protein